MCRICDRDPPEASDFYNFRAKILEAKERINNLSNFIDEATNMDKLRFTRGDEWGEPNTRESVIRLVFSNPNPDEGLLLFALSCWLDMQAPYTTVWTTYLRQAKNWICGNSNVPRGKYPHTTPHLVLTRKTVKNQGNLSRWLVRTILTIVQNHGRNNGNLYRFSGEVCNDLYSKPEIVPLLRSGHLPTAFSGGDHKRFWMFTMFLRRDNSFVRCLFTRALSQVPDGQEAIRYWYGHEYFNPLECELPVDLRVLSNWNNVFKKIGMVDYLSQRRSQTARRARDIARASNVSPSVFDAILFF